MLGEQRRADLPRRAPSDRRERARGVRRPARSPIGIRPEYTGGPVGGRTRSRLRGTLPVVRAARCREPRARRAADAAGPHRGGPRGRARRRRDGAAGAARRRRDGTYARSGRASTGSYRRTVPGEAVEVAVRCAGRYTCSIWRAARRSGRSLRRGRWRRDIDAATRSGPPAIADGRPAASCRRIRRR